MSNGLPSYLALAGEMLRRDEAAEVAESQAAAGVANG
jgi:hypothetical protein